MLISALRVYFVNDTPTLTEDSIYAEIGINRPEAKIECHITRTNNTRKDCEENIINFIPANINFSIHVIGVGR